MKLNVIGRWAIIVGIILAILSAFTSVPNLGAILFVLGLVVGFLNIKDKESTSFLIAIIALIVIGLSGLRLGFLTETVSVMLENFLAFVAAAGLIVALRQVLSFVRPAA